MCELKNLQASGLTTLGHALRTAFDLLNLNRLVSGIDNYGQVFGSSITLCISLAAASSVAVRDSRINLYSGFSVFLKGLIIILIRAVNTQFID